MKFNLFMAVLWVLSFGHEYVMLGTIGWLPIVMIILFLGCAFVQYKKIKSITIDLQIK